MVKCLLTHIRNERPGQIEAIERQRKVYSGVKMSMERNVEKHRQMSQKSISGVRCDKTMAREKNSKDNVWLAFQKQIFTSLCQKYEGKLRTPTT